MPDGVLEADVGGLDVGVNVAGGGIVAALDVPLVHFSVYWWRTLHQPPSIVKPGPATMPGIILGALLINFVAFTILYLYFVTKRVGLLRAQEEAAA